MHVLSATHRKRRSLAGKGLGHTHSNSKNQQNNRAKVRDVLGTGPAMFQPKLRIGAQNDPLERQADRVADWVMGVPDNQISQGRINEVITPVTGGIQRACEDCEEQEEPLQAKTMAGQEASVGAGVESGISTLKNGGTAMSEQSRAFFEPRFGQRFDNVKLHTGGQAQQLASDVNARAFTIGNHIVFGQNEFQPDTDSGKRLMGHELTHVVQQGQSDVIRRETLDPLCSSFDYIAKKAAIDLLISDFKTTADVEKRLSLIVELKWIIRCAADTEKTEVQAKLNSELTEDEGNAIWREAALPFAGYRGLYPGYYGGGKGRLKRLGTSEVEGFDSFNYDLASPSANSAQLQAGTQKVAATEVATMEKTDILYFYGDQYAQYGWPGLFSKFSPKNRFIDLKALEGQGDFSRVKLMISTSCATCCKEAIETFAGIFPNAVFLGYRKSAPAKGELVRNAFDSKIKALGYPLLIDNPVDVGTMINLWKSVIERYHPNESRRLPGYYQNGTVHYFELGVWKSMGATDAANSCFVKGNDVHQAN